MTRSAVHLLSRRLAAYKSWYYEYLHLPREYNTCVQKGHQNALFGAGRGRRSVAAPDLALLESTIPCRIIDFWGLPASDSAHFQYFVPKKLPEIAL